MSLIPGSTGSPTQLPDGFIGAPLANVQTISTILVLTSTSNKVQIITASGGTQTVQLPSALIKSGEGWTVVNPSTATNALLVNSSNGSLVTTLVPGTSVNLYSAIAAPAAAADWNIQSSASGGASGSSGINYISNPQFENALTTGWATYNNTAGATPITGTGGTPAVTFAAQSGSNTRGTYSGRLSKSAANRQGDGVAFAFTIDAQDKGKPLNITFDALASANFVAGDVGVYIYDVTNNTLINPASVTVAAGTFSFNAFFVATTSTSYRLILHVASTNSTAGGWTLDTDNFNVGPSIPRVGAPVTDWQSYTPVLQGTTSNPNIGSTGTAVGRWRRAGDSIEIEAVITASGTGITNGSGNFVIGLPNNLLIDTSKVTVVGGGFGAGFPTVGSGSYLDAGVGGAFLRAVPFFNGSITGVGLTTINSDDLVGQNKPAANWWSAAGDSLTVRATLPISQWSSNVTMADRSVEEYCSNSSTSDADDTASFVYGATGSAVPGTLTAPRSKRVRFQTPIQATDKVVLEFLDVNNGVWASCSDSRLGNLGYTTQNTTRYGVRLAVFSTTDVDVEFQTYARPNGATFSAAGDNWSTAAAAIPKWRVRKVASGAQIGYPVSGKNVIPEEVIQPISANTTINFGTGVRFITSGSAYTLQTIVSGTDDGKRIVVKNAQGGSVVVTPANGFIDGASSITLGAYDSINVMAYLANWFII